MRRFLLALAGALLLSSSPAGAATVSDSQGDFTVNLSALSADACALVPRDLEGVPACPERPAGIDNLASSQNAGREDEHRMLALLTLLKEGTAFGTATVMQFPGTLKREMTSNGARDFEDGVIKGVVAQLGPHGKVNKRAEELRIHELQTFHVVAELEPAPGAPRTHFVFFSFVTATGGYGVFLSGPSAGAAWIDSLAATIASTVRAKPAPPALSADYRAGYLFGSMFGGVAGLAVVAGVVVVIVRRRRPPQAAPPPLG